MDRRAFIKTARLLLAAEAISNKPHGPDFDPTALKQFQEILEYPDEQLNRFLQNPANQGLLLRLEDIAKNQILYEVLKKTL